MAAKDVEDLGEEGEIVGRKSEHCRKVRCNYSIYQTLYGH